MAQDEGAPSDQAARLLRTGFAAVLSNPEAIAHLVDAGYFFGDLEEDDGFTSRYLRDLGYADQDMRSGAYRDNIHPEDQDTYLALWRRVDEGWENELHCDYRLKDQRGNWRWIRTHAVVLSRRANGRIAKVFGTDRDISPEKRAEEYLREQFRETQRRYEVAESLRRTSTLVVSDLELSSSLAAALEQMKAILDFQRCDVYARDSEGVIRPVFRDEQRQCSLPDPAPFLKWIASSVYPIIEDDVGGEFSARSWMGVPLRDANELVGAVFLWHQEPGFFRGGDLYPVMAFAESLTVAVANNQRYRRTVTELETDELTGVFSRGRLEHDIPTLWAQYCTSHHDNTLALVDVDHFQHINDTYGHEAGDTVLRRVASLIRTSVAEDDIVIRYGGDEFVVLLPNRSVDAASRLLEHFRSACEHLDICDYAGSVSVSIGATSCGPQTSDRPNLRAVLAQASRALSQAKQQGGNRIKTAPVETDPSGTTATD